MLCLSVRQPWVHGIFNLGKPIENRDWPTKVRGCVLIHASKTMTLDDRAGFLDTCERLGILIDAREFEQLPRGAIVGSVEIVDCVKQSSSPWFFGPYGFVLRSPIQFKKPIPYSGRLKFFDVPDDLVREAA